MTGLEEKKKDNTLEFDHNCYLNNMHQAFNLEVLLDSIFSLQDPLFSVSTGCL